jgi:hypothetical protein
MTQGQNVAHKPKDRVNKGSNDGLIELDLRTKATSGEVVEQAKAPVTIPVRIYFTVQRIFVANFFHRGSSLYKRHMINVKQTNLEGAE